jgi:hypothetical protein
MLAPYPLWVAILMQGLRPTFNAPYAIDFDKMPPRPYEKADPGVYRFVQSVVAIGIAPGAMEMAADVIARGEAFAILTKTGRRALDFETPGYAFGWPLERWREILADTIVTEPPGLLALVRHDVRDPWLLKDRHSALHAFFGEVVDAADPTRGIYLLNDDQILRYVAWSEAEERFRASTAGTRYDPRFGEEREQLWYPTPIQHEWLRLNDLLPGVVAATQR